MEDVNVLRERLARLERLDIERRRAEERFRGLLEAAPDAIVIVDGRGRITLVNAQTETLFGYSRDDLLGQPVELLVPERFRDRHGAHRDRYGADARTRSMGDGLDLTGRRKDGSEFPVEISLSPLKVDEDVLVISIIRDLTERKSAEEELRVHKALLERKVREMDDFLHVVSHDLKEPLRGIEAFSGFLLEDYGTKPDDQGVRYLNFLKQAAVRMKDLIHDLLTLASISKKEPTFQTVELDRVVGRVRQDLGFSLPAP